MSISNMIGNNIKKLIEENDLSYRKVSEAIGVTHPTLKRYVDGEQPIDSEKLMSIARYFNKPFEYFFSEGYQDPQFLFRADNPQEKLSPEDIQKFIFSMKSYSDVFVDSIIHYLPQRYLLEVSGKKLNEKEDALIEKIAYEQRRIMNIDKIIPANYFSVIEQLGINVIVRDFRNDDFFGASSYSKEYGSFILVNASERISEERQLFSLIHEYGHLLFHSDQYISIQSTNMYTSYRSETNEMVANRFAGYFLMPRYLINEYNQSFDSKIDLKEMKHYFKVSLNGLLYSLNNYGLLPKDTYKNYIKHIKTNHYEKIEPDPLEKIGFEKKNSKLIQKIKELFVDDKISASKISEVLGIGNLTTRNLLKEWSEVDDRYLRIS
ncbi:MAG: XRE family transcriptional regulator [Firmicutes bacterium]|nr:XRE family transcriptional regulator [Bacillota bacterium]